MKLRIDGDYSTVVGNNLRLFNESLAHQLAANMKISPDRITITAIVNGKE